MKGEKGLMFQEILKNKKPNKQKLLAFGFKELDEGYVYSAELVDSQMKLIVTVSKDEKLETQVTDNNSGEEYVLHLVSGATGSFVGRVKAEYDNVLKEIFLNCFDFDVFKSEQAKKVIAYARQKYGDEPEHLWHEVPDNAILRRKDSTKWYAALLTVSRRKLGFDCDERVEILDLRIKPENIDTLIDNKKYFAGYHMNKKHWFTVCLDGTVEFEEICNRIDNSYDLATERRSEKKEK